MDKVKRYHFHLLALSLAGYFIGTGIHGVAGGSAGPLRTMAGLLGGAILAFVLSIVMHGRNKDLRPAMKVQEGDERIQRIRGCQPASPSMPVRSVHFFSGSTGSGRMI